MIDQADNTGDPLHVLFGFAPLAKAADESGQGHDTLFHRSGYVGCINVRVRSQLVLHISFDIGV
jgi:hypothetical protein